MEMTAIPRLQDADLKNKVVLVRVDHNVVKKGKIIDPYRIDATLSTLFNIVARGGKLILMTHIGRPRDKKTGIIKIDQDTSVKPIIDYLEHKLNLRIRTPVLETTEKGILGIDTSVNLMIKELKDGRIDCIYLPNTRYFCGEEQSGDVMERFGAQLAGLADIYVNDAFGSWQPHASTVKPPEYIPSYAGLLMQKEIDNLDLIFNPIRPFVAAVAGSKFDTKIAPLKVLLDKVDHLILGGIIYNAYLCIKYGISIEGISQEDIDSAKEFVEISQAHPGKIIEPPIIIESDTIEGKIEGSYRAIDIKSLKRGDKLKYVLDIGADAFDNSEIQSVFMNARTIFVNAVMGLTPHFAEGTKAMYSLINANKNAMKMFGGGDTLQELKTLLPGLYMKELEDTKCYFFTGGGTILTTVELGTPVKLESIQALIKNKERLDLGWSN